MSVVVASPKIVLPSTVKVEAVVVERVVPPTTVMALAKTSPSASTRNLAEPLTESDKRLESAVADEGIDYQASSQDWLRTRLYSMSRNCAPKSERIQLPIAR